MPRQLVYGNVYAQSNSEHPVSQGELNLIREVVEAARHKVIRARFEIGDVARIMAADRGALDRLTARTQMNLNQAFFLNRERGSRRIDFAQQISQKFDRIDRGMRGELEVFDLPRDQWNGNKQRYERQARVRMGRAQRLQMIEAHGGVAQRSPTGICGHVLPVPGQGGRINLCYPYLARHAHSVWTLIHEASHLFAATRDCVYVYTDTLRWKAPLTTAQAANNADSYAMFAANY
jgi:Lysine-specific metallo-endopeptidase